MNGTEATEESEAEVTERERDKITTEKQSNEEPENNSSPFVFVAPPARVSLSRCLRHL